jgi:Amt family ammonium transporter
LGAVAGCVVILGIDLLEYLRIDDPIGAWPVHGLCGIWGTLSLGLFACGQYSAGGSSPSGIPTIDANNPALTGLFYGGGTKVLLAQCIGSFTICAATFIVAMAVFVVLNMAGLLRISKEGEIEGMDIHEHGMPAYPEYVVAPWAAPAGVGSDLVNASASSGRTSSAAHREMSAV